LNVDEVGGNRHSLNQKVRRKRGGDDHRTSCLKKVAMLVLNYTVLSMSDKTRELGKSTLLS
jgi:hypothetical protein